MIKKGIECTTSRALQGLNNKDAMEKYCSHLPFSVLLQTNKRNEWLDTISSRFPASRDQFRYVVRAVSANQVYYSKCKNAYIDIQYLLKDRFNDYFKLNVLGSCDSGLALKKSDIDLVIHLKDNHPIKPPEIVSVMSQVFKGSIKFTRVRAIQAKVPIIRCQHESGISCDVSFCVGVDTRMFSHSLVKFLVQSDSRIRDTIILLKFLVELKSLGGTSGISSYSLILLVIFYLQQLEEAMVPSIHYLQSMSKSQHIVLGWNTSFATKPFVLPSSKNQMDLLELLLEFFKFYKSFNYENYVISPFLGKPILKSNFKDLKLVPVELETYKQLVQNKVSLALSVDSPCCLQEPIKHSSNTLKSLNNKILNRFIDFCTESEMICLREFRTKEKTGSSQFFTNLFRT